MEVSKGQRHDNSQHYRDSIEGAASPGARYEGPAYTPIAVVLDDTLVIQGV